jgi:hypothetical protein
LHFVACLLPPPSPLPETTSYRTVPYCVLSALECIVALAGLGPEVVLYCRAFSFWYTSGRWPFVSSTGTFLHNPSAWFSALGSADIAVDAKEYSGFPHRLCDFFRKISSGLFCVSSALNMDAYFWLQCLLFLFCFFFA